jgi:acetyl esterase/lipase
MTNVSLIFRLVFSILLLGQLAGCEKKHASQIDPVAALYSGTQVISNIEYSNIDSISLTLDAYIQTKRLGEPPWVEYSEKRKPTLLFLHGGGWTSGDKISRSLFLMPYVNKHWCVVTANYRHLDQAGLIDIIRDGRSALNWIYENAGKYKFDTTKIVVSGESAGGHLSLMTGLSTDESLFNQGNIKPGRKLKVAAIVNWFGVADLVKASATWDANYLNQVVPNAPERDSILKVASPIQYVTSSSPPIMTIHGDQDVSAPYDQGVLLHEKLKTIGNKNFFLTIPGKKHGNFDAAEMTMIYNEIWKFLEEIGVK